MRLGVTLVHCSISILMKVELLFVLQCAENCVHWCIGSMLRIEKFMALNVQSVVGHLDFKFIICVFEHTQNPVTTGKCHSVVFC